jgi:hypothetical protein
MPRSNYHSAFNLPWEQEFHGDFVDHEKYITTIEELCAVSVTTNTGMQVPWVVYLAIQQESFEVRTVSRTQT